MAEPGRYPCDSISRRYLLAGLFLLWLLVRGGSFYLSQNYSYDAVSRTRLAQYWHKNPHLIPYGQEHHPTQYSPLPIYLMGLSLYLWNQPQFSPRLVSLIFGCLTLLPFYHLVRLAFGRRNALYASLFLALFSLHIKSSAIASSETIFCFFLLCGVYYIYKFKRQQRKSHFLLAALFMNLAAMSRYTGLLYILLLGLLIVDRNRLRYSLKMGILFWVFCLILPGLWLWFQHNALGALYPFEFILGEHARIVKHFRGPSRRLYYLLFWPGVVGLSLTPGVAGLSLVGMREELRRREHLGFLLLAVAPYLFFMYRSVIIGDLFLMPRFVIDSSIFLLPFAVIGIDKLQTSLPRRWQPHLPRIVIGSIVLWLVLVVILSHNRWPILRDKMRAVSPLSQLEPGQQRIVSFLQREQPGGQIIIDHNPTWSELEIMFYSSLPWERFNTNIRRPQTLIDYINLFSPQYLILLPRGRLSRSLTSEMLDMLPQQCGVRPQLLFDEAGYRLYRLARVGGEEGSYY
jgi:4-amino-4-deoxy-L-arabinose transferase-like glycosyltransferase